MAGGNMFYAAPRGPMRPEARPNPLAWGGGVKRKNKHK